MNAYDHEVRAAKCTENVGMYMLHYKGFKTRRISILVFLLYHSESKFI